MKSKILTDDKSLLIMFRLGAIEGALIDDNHDAKDVFNDTIAEEDLAVIILTKSIYNLIKKEVEAFRDEESTPLIVVIDG